MQDFDLPIRAAYGSQVLNNNHLNRNESQMLILTKSTLQLKFVYLQRETIMSNNFNVDDLMEKGQATTNSDVKGWDLKNETPPFSPISASTMSETLKSEAITESGILLSLIITLLAKSLT